MELGGEAGRSASADEHDELARQQVALARYWQAVGDGGRARRAASLATIHRRAAAIKRELELTRRPRAA